MTRSASLPFTIRRSEDVLDSVSVTTTKETVHGLLHLGEEQVRIEWRVYRRTDHVGTEIRSDKEVGAVHSVTVPLHRIASAHVRRRRWLWPVRLQLILTAADLQAFEDFAGKHGLRLDHPAKLVLSLRRSDRLLAEEFVAELALAVAELGAGRDRVRSLPDSPEALLPPNLAAGDE